MKALRASAEADIPLRSRFMDRTNFPVASGIMGLPYLLSHSRWNFRTCHEPGRTALYTLAVRDPLPALPVRSLIPLSSLLSLACLSEFRTTQSLRVPPSIKLALRFQNYRKNHGHVNREDENSATFFLLGWMIATLPVGIVSQTVLDPESCASYYTQDVDANCLQKSTSTQGSRKAMLHLAIVACTDRIGLVGR